MNVNLSSIKNKTTNFSNQFSKTNKPTSFSLTLMTLFISMMLLGGTAFAATGISITSPFDGANVRNLVPVAWTLDGIGTDLIDVKYSSNGGSSWTDITTLPPGSEGYSWDTTTTSNGDGTNYKLYVFERNTAIFDITEIFTIDNTNPTITISDDTSTTWTNSDTISVSVSDTPAGILETKSIISASNTCDSSVDIALDAGIIGTSVIANNDAIYQNNYICFRTTDNAGNKNYAVSSQITKLDTTAPTISSVALGSDEYINSADATSGVDIIVSTSGVEDGQTVTCSVTDETTTISSLTGIIDTNTITIATGSLTGLNDVLLTASCDVSDVAGNPATTGTDTATKETVAPINSNNLPTSPQNNNQPTITVDLSDVTTGIDTSTITVTVNDGSTTHLSSVGTGNAQVSYNGNTLTIDPTIATAFTLADGTTTVTVNVDDIAGNSMTQLEWTFTVDTTAPTISSVALGSDEYINSADATSGVDIIVSTSGVEDGQTVTCSVTDETTTISSLTGIIDTNTITIATGSLTGLNDVLLTASCDVSDVAGNPATTGTDTATKETVAPINSNNLPTSPQNNNQPTITVDLSDVTTGIDTSTITVTVNDGSTTHLSSVGTGNAQVSYNGNTLTIDPTIATAFTLADGTTTVTVNVDDIAGNSMTQLEWTFTVDTTAPTVLTAVASPSLAMAGTVTTTITFNEATDGTTSPTVEFTGLTGTMTSNTDGAWSLSNTVWTESFILSDANEDVTVTITVSGAKDIADNTMVADSNAGTFDIDTINPTVITITPSLSLIKDSSVGTNTFTIAIDYNEAMSGASTPIITFTPDITTTLTLTSGTWTDADTYTITYNVADAEILTADVDISVTGAKDIADNTQTAGNSIDAFDIDTENPTVSSSTASPNLAKDGSVTITVVFSELMDTSTDATIQVTGLTTTPYSVTKTSYIDNTWIGTFELLDQDEIATATISVSGAKDLVTNVMTVDTTGTFSVDTISPLGTVTLGTTTITDEDLIQEVTVTYTEAMDSESTPTITFGATTGIITAGTGSWTSNNVWEQTFTITDANEETTGVSVSSSLATDVAGNVEGTSTDATFNVDTKNPTGTVTVNTATLTDGTLTQTVTVTYTEAMASGSRPTITFGATTGTISSNSGGAWSNGNIWTETFTITDANEKTTGVSVSSSLATDAAGNVESTSTDATFNVDTKNPTGTVTVNTATLTDGTLTQTVTVTYTEAMASGSRPTITFGATTGTISSNSGGAWSNGNIWTETFTITDANEKTTGVSVSSSLATDAAGNVESTSTDATFNVDTKNPTGYTVSIDQLYINDANKNAMSFTFADAEIDATYNYVVGDGSSTVTGTGTISTITDTINGINVSTLDDGTLTLTVILTDNARNVGEDAADTVTKDVVSPTITSIAVDKDPAMSNDVLTITFDVDEALTANPTITVDENAADYVSKDGTTYTYTYTVAGTETEGDVMIAVSATDVAGNTRSATKTDLTLDFTAPSITSYTIDNINIAPNAATTNTTTINVAFLEPVQANIEILDSNNDAIKNIYTSTGYVSNPEGKTWDGTDEDSNIVPYGTYTIKIELTDTAGNTFTDTSKIITIYDLILNMNNGWNLISIPKTLTDNTKTNVFTGTTWSYNTSANDWITSGTINPGYGYWVESNGDSIGINYAECGGAQQAPCSETLTLPVGWNLIGHMSKTTQPINESLQTISGKYSFLLKYNDQTDDWARVQ